MDIYIRLPLTKPLPLYLYTTNKFLVKIYFIFSKI